MRSYRNIRLNGNPRPIDIVVDLSLIHKEDLEESMETWAYLILSCAELKNVNFIFKQPNFLKDGSYPELLSEDLNNAPSESDVIVILIDKLKQKSAQLNMTDEVETIIKIRLNQEERENAIRIPIISEMWLKWLRGMFQGKKIKIKEMLRNSYTISIEELTTCDGGIALRNFNAALSIGLAKAFLVIYETLEDQEGSFELKKRLCIVMNDLYSTLRKDRSGDITERTLDFLISDKIIIRLNMAISLSISKIIRRAITIIKEKHDMVQLYLHSA